jgi:hypothetical protein
MKSIAAVEAAVTAARAAAGIDEDGEEGYDENGDDYDDEYYEEDEYDYYEEDEEEAGDGAEHANADDKTDADTGVDVDTVVTVTDTIVDVDSVADFDPIATVAVGDDGNGNDGDGDGDGAAIADDGGGDDGKDETVNCNDDIGDADNNGEGSNDGGGDDVVVDVVVDLLAAPQKLKAVEARKIAPPEVFTPKATSQVGRVVETIEHKGATPVGPEVEQFVGRFDNDAPDEEKDLPDLNKLRGFDSEDSEDNLI